ncbi:hypothetical protein [Agarilytica rhodophyticola]|uniref:hypothetical protein n=1 Tax=Agarilytica rhodophyticola TaxID=1737490 RepID=UPI000CD843DC|nr:hypothetical protein [Agarilytica rhodophyticola]
MNLELDHFFILVEPEAKIADELVSIGMKESVSRIHEGQGTANRCFRFSNVLLEFLWIRDWQQANRGKVGNLFLPQRVKYPQASPFGVVLHRKDGSDVTMPFPGWEYQPDYFPAPKAFHIGDNASDILEPLCIYAPFIEPSEKTSNTIVEQGNFKYVRNVCIYTPVQVMSEALNIANTVEGLSIINDEQHLMEIVFDDHSRGLCKDLRPEIPLVLYW